MTNAELFAFLFNPPSSDAEETLTHWARQSRRFQAFLVENRAKVRKKLRLARTPEALQSLLWELDIARQLTDDLRCQVEYEKQDHGNERSPDLTVTFRTRTIFNLEATRVQMAQEQADARAEKLLRIVCNKLGQAVPQMLNGLVIATDHSAVTEDEVTAAMRTLKRRVDQRDPTLPLSGISTPAEFYKQFQCLNALILCSASEHDAIPQTTLWTNPQSRHPLPPDIRTFLQTTLSLTTAANNAVQTDKSSSTPTT